MKKILFSTLCIGLLAMSCKKKHETIPEPTPTSDLKAFYADKIEDATQTFNINSATGGTFTGENGVVITVPANGFVYADGSPVAGTIKFELIEVLDYKTMVLLNKSTTSGGELLVSGGQLKLTASRGGTEVLLADGYAVDVYVPTASPDENMRLFEGTEDEDGFVEWEAIEDTVVIVEVEDSVVIEYDYYYFEFVNEKLGWINCDYMGWPDGVKTTVTCTLPEEFTFEYANVFAVFPGYNSVYRFYSADAELSAFTGTNIPVGIDAKFVAVGNIDDVYYSCFTDMTNVVTDHEEIMIMSTTTLEEIEEAVADL